MDKKLTPEEMTKLNALFTKSCNGTTTCETLLLALKDFLTRDDAMGINYYLELEPDVREFDHQCAWLRSEGFTFERVQAISAHIDELQETLAHLLGGHPYDYIQTTPS